MPSTLDRNDLQNAIRLAGSYLVNACGPDGRFRYATRRAETSAENLLHNDYNIVRHCGAVYAMVLCEIHDPGSIDLSALNRAAGYVRDTALAKLPGQSSVAAIWSLPGQNDSVGRTTAKLGAAGLALAAFSLLKRLYPESIPTEELRSLIGFIGFMQKKDGSFYSKFIGEDGGYFDKDWDSLFYSGEAVLGLVLYCSLHADRQALSISVSALEYLARLRAGKSKVFEDHWALVATSRLFALPDSGLTSPSAALLSTHAEQVTASLLEHMVRLRGQSPRPCSVAIRLEGLLAACDILPPQNGLLRDAVTGAIRYGMNVLLSSQVREGPLAGGIPHKKRLRGESTPSDDDIRIDYVQHALCAFIETDRRFEFLTGQSPRRVPSTGDAALHLEESLALSSQFIVRQQLPDGNFRYERNWTTGEPRAADNAVRQAGTQWALALHARATGSPDSAAAAVRALEYFDRHSAVTEEGGRYLVYPAADQGKIGAVALWALTIIELLRVDVLDRVQRDQCASRLDELLVFLRRARTDKDQWYSRYRHDNGEPFGKPSAYFDGESLLALVRAAKYVDGYASMQPLVMRCAANGFLFNILAALRRDRKSQTTKGYYQWSTMAYFELFTSGWNDTAIYGEHILYLADWVIDVHRVLVRKRNTAYAFEGLACAYAVAAAVGDETRREKYQSAIELGLGRLLSWQVGHSLANSYIRAFEARPDDLGGVQGAACDGMLRIDTTQHMLHAVLLCLHHVYGRVIPTTARQTDEQRDGRGI